MNFFGLSLMDHHEDSIQSIGQVPSLPEGKTDDSAPANLPSKDLEDSTKKSELSTDSGVKCERSASSSESLDSDPPKQLVIDMTVNGSEMSHGGSVQQMPLSDSFWELGNYKRTVKRIDDGSNACHQLMQMIKERGELETSYAKHLRAWSKKWSDHIDKGLDYGTSQDAWRACLTEAEQQADLHTRIRDRLTDEVYATIKLWQKDNFHHKALGGIKEAREVEDEFKKAQKPWAKLYSHVERAKKSFHASCKNERSAINQEKNARGDTNVTPDQQKKLTDKVEQCRKEREKATDAYNKALGDLNNYNGKYMEDMTMVFEKCQEMDRARLKFFKEMLFGMHKCLDLSSEPKLSKIYSDYYGTVDRSDPAADLKLWSQQHGTEMPMNWPVFEDFADDLDTLYAAAEALKKTTRINTSDYSPELRQISKKASKQTELANAGGVILIRSKPNNNIGNGDVDNRQSMPAVISDSSSQQASTSGSPAPDHQRPVSTAVDHVRPESTSPTSDQRDVSVSPIPEMTKSDSNGYAEESDLVDDGRAGVPVKALYDYAAQEDDELALSKANKVESKNEVGVKGIPIKALYDYTAVDEDELSLCQGDVFDKLEEPDEQGWCKGRKDGRVGLYPANYAVPV